MRCPRVAQRNELRRHRVWRLPHARATQRRVDAHLGERLVRSERLACVAEQLGLAEFSAGGWHSVARIEPACSIAPIVCCTAKTNSEDSSPTIGFAGSASATSGSGFLVKGTNFINNKSCLLFYGVNGQASGAFQGGTLCVKSPIKRTPGTNTFGNPPPNDCSGVPQIDMNSFAVGGRGGTPLPALTVPGSVVDCQWWGRDPGFVAPNNTQLSDGLEYTVAP